MSDNWTYISVNHVAYVPLCMMTVKLKVGFFCFFSLLAMVSENMKFLNSKNFLKMSNLETSLLLLKIQTFVIVYNVVFILA